MTTLAEELRHLVRQAKVVPYERAWDKAEKYVKAQATKGFTGCTLPYIKDYDTARYIVEKFAAEKVSCSSDKDAGGFLISVRW